MNREDANTILHKMSTFLDLYLEQSPRDAEAWIDRATLALATGNSAKAEESLLRALAADREKAVAAIEKDPKLLDLAQEAISRRQRGGMKRLDYRVQKVMHGEASYERHGALRRLHAKPQTENRIRHDEQRNAYKRRQRK